MIKGNEQTRDRVVGQDRFVERFRIDEYTDADGNPTGQTEEVILETSRYDVSTGPGFEDPPTHVKAIELFEALTWDEQETIRASTNAQVEAFMDRVRFGGAIPITRAKAGVALLFGQARADELFGA